MLFWGCRVWTGMGGSRQTQSSLTSSGMQLGADPSAFPRPQCLPSSSAQPFLAAAAVRGAPMDPLCQLWLLQLPLLGTRGDPWIQPPAPLAAPALQPLEEFSMMGQGVLEDFTPTHHSSFRRARGSHCPLPSPQPLPWHCWHQDWGSHSHSRMAVPCPSCRQRGFFPPPFSWAVG